MTTIALFLLTGFGMGLLSGLLGIGGGVILVPMLIFFFGMEQHLAQGISMLIIIPISISGLWALRNENLIDFSIVTRIAAGAVIGVMISASFVQYVPASILRKIFGIFVLYAGMKMIMGKKKE